MMNREIVENFKKAFKDMSRMTDDIYNDNKSFFEAFNKEYPFDKSFDDLTCEVENWLDNILDEVVENEE